MKRKIQMFGIIIMLVMVFFGTNKTVYAANDSMKNAKTIYMNTNYSDYLTKQVGERFYKFTLSESGEITLKLKAYMYRSSWHIYNSNGECLYHCEANYWNDVTEMYSTIDVNDLTKGTYYLCIEDTYYTGKFEFQMSFSSANESFSEEDGGNNNLMTSANYVDFNKLYKGQIAVNDNKDFYKFRVNENCKIRLDLKSFIYRTNYKIYDEDGFTVKENNWNYYNSVTESFVTTDFLDLSPGVYYLCIEESYYTGNYNFKLSKSAGSIVLNKNKVSLEKNSTITLKATLKPSTGEKINWESDDKKIATVNSKGVVKTIRTGKTVIRAYAGDDLRAECVIYVKPSATKLNKVKKSYKNGKYRYVSLKWKKIKDIDGYEIYYSTKKNGKYKKATYTSYNDVTSVVIGLKRKKNYYIKVRTYRYMDQKKFTGKWSNTIKYRAK